MRNYTHTLNEGFDSYFKKLDKSLNESRLNEENNVTDFLPEIFSLSDDDLIHVVQSLWKSSDPYLKGPGGIFNKGSRDQYRYWAARKLIIGRMNGKSDDEIKKEIISSFNSDELEESLKESHRIRKNKKLSESYKDYKFIENLIHEYLISIYSLKKSLNDFESYIKNTDPSEYSARNIKRQLSNMFSELHGISKQNNKIGFSNQKDKKVDPDIEEKIDKLRSISGTRTAKKTSLETTLHYVYDVYNQTLEDYPPSEINDLYSEVYRTIIEIGDNEAAEKFGIDLDTISSSK